MAWRRERENLAEEGRASGLSIRSIPAPECGRHSPRNGTGQQGQREGPGGLWGGRGGQGGTSVGREEPELDHGASQKRAEGEPVDPA